MGNELLELSKYGSTGIAIAIIGAGIYIARLFFQQNKEIRMGNERTLGTLSNAIDRNTKMVERSTDTTKELHEFMVNLNGSLRRTVHNKQKSGK